MFWFGPAIVSSVQETTLSVLHSSAQSDNHHSHWSECAGVEISTNQVLVYQLIKQITPGWTSQSKVNNTTAYFLSSAEDQVIDAFCIFRTVPLELQESGVNTFICWGTWFWWQISSCQTGHIDDKHVDFNLQKDHPSLGLINSFTLF